MQGQRSRPRAKFVTSQEDTPVCLKGGNGFAAAEDVDFEVAGHEGELNEQFSPVFLFNHLAGHGLRNPVGVGELFERIWMGVFDDGNGIDGDFPPCFVGDGDVLDGNLVGGGDEKGNGRFHPIKLRHNLGIPQPHATFIRFVLIQCRHDKRRKDFVAVFRVQPQIQSSCLSSQKLVAAECIW